MFGPAILAGAVEDISVASADIAPVFDMSAEIASSIVSP
jgi:hypothetical protein